MTTLIQVSDTQANLSNSKYDVGGEADTAVSGDSYFAINTSCKKDVLDLIIKDAYSSKKYLTNRLAKLVADQ